jgi:hypothetical protein
MSPYPTSSNLDYSGGGDGYFDFMPLESQSLAVCLGEAKTPLFYARIDPVLRQMVYANARREAALLVRQNSARVFHLEDGGSMRLEPGDVLAAFTQDISEDTVIQVIREHPGESAGMLVERILEPAHGTTVAVRFITNEAPALAEDAATLADESSAPELAVA